MDGSALTHASTAARPLVDRLVQIAGSTAGKFVVCAYGEGSGQVRHIPNDAQAARRIMAATDELAAIAGANVYILPGLVRADLPEGSRGSIKDTVARLALVADFDRHEGTAIDWAAKMPVEPHCVVETSPGNFQCWLLFDKPYRPDHVAPIGKAFVPLLDDRDGVIGDMARVVRVPGSLNYPNGKKLAEGRSAIPFTARLVTDVEDWHAGYALEGLRAAIERNDPAAFDQAHMVASDAANFDWSKRQKPSEPAKPLDDAAVIRALSKGGDRSAAVFTLIRRLQRVNYSAEEIAAVLLKFSSLPVMKHYGDPISEDRLRDDLRRAFGKKDEPSYERSAAETFGNFSPGSGNSEAPAAEPLILNPAAPLKSAVAFMQLKHTLPSGERALLHFEDGYYQWQRSHWVEAEKKAIDRQLYGFLDTAMRQPPPGADGKPAEPVPFNPTRNRVSDIEHALSSITHISDVVPPCWISGGSSPAPAFDPSEIVACKNGLLHLPTRQLLPHTPRLLTLNALPFAFDPQTPSPARWLAFLKSLWPDDQESIDTLQEIFGLLLTGDTSQQKLFMLVGPRRSGKGTIARVLSHVLGEANVCNPTLASLSHPFGLQPLIGKSAAIIADARLGARADASVVAERLLSISGEDRQSVPRKYQGDWHGGIGARFLILSNELPRITDASATLASRFIMLTLRESFFGREDIGLTKALLTEAPGILNWSLNGYAQLRARGYFATPKSSAATQHELEELGSPTLAFLNECCAMEPGQVVLCDALYSAWCAWCEKSGHSFGSSQTFGRNLRAAMPALVTAQHRGGPNRGKRYFGGVGLAAQA